LHHLGEQSVLDRMNALDERRARFDGHRLLSG
jgi:hypothetical protein